MVKDKKKPLSYSKGSLDFLTTLIWALVIAMVVRTFFFQSFHIPSGSMQPNLVKGDYIITSKYSVGYGKYAADPIPFPKKSGRLFEKEPKRGDIVVFKSDGEARSLIKRLVGLPGDKLQIVDGILHVNQKPVDLKFVATETFEMDNGLLGQADRMQETLSSGRTYHVFDEEKNSRLDNTAIFEVPEDKYFFLGDNRDQSGDSRMTSDEGGVGLIPAENLIGRAEFVLLSVTDEFSIIRPWTWHEIRSDRFFVGLR